jgi:hypothetical protein
MKYPEPYSSIYAMSSCCLMNNPQPPGQGRGPGAGAANRGPARGPASGEAATNGRAGARGRGGRGGGGGFANVQFAEAAAWSSNPMKPPMFFDMPTEDGKFQPEVAAKWVANSPLAFTDQYLPQLRSFKAITMDVGTKDTLFRSNEQMDALLTQFGIKHTYETYDGDHTNHVKDRFIEKVLPFFTEQLSFVPAKNQPKVQASR